MKNPKSLQDISIKVVASNYRNIEGILPKELVSLVEEERKDCCWSKNCNKELYIIAAENGHLNCIRKFIKKPTSDYYVIDSEFLYKLIDYFINNQSIGHYYVFLKEIEENYYDSSIISDCCKLYGSNKIVSIKQLIEAINNDHSYCQGYFMDSLKENGINIPEFID